MSIKEKLSALKGARKIEWIVLLAAAAVLALLFVREDSFLAAQGGTELEARIETVLSMVNGAGRVRVLVNEQAQEQAAFVASAPGAKTAAKGVVIVAEGAGDVRVSMELARAVKTLLDIELDRIEVLTMDGGK